jgi:hypothetical protein
MRYTLSISAHILAQTAPIQKQCILLAMDQFEAVVKVCVSRANNQKALSKPACLRTALAVCLDLILESTGTLLFVMGLNQISWSPFP